MLSSLSPLCIGVATCLGVSPLPVQLDLLSRNIIKMNLTECLEVHFSGESRLCQQLTLATIGWEGGQAIGDAPLRGMLGHSLLPLSLSSPPGYHVLSSFVFHHKLLAMMFHITTGPKSHGQATLDQWNYESINLSFFDCVRDFVPVTES